MNVRKLEISRGYDSLNQRTIGMLAAQLDDQLRALKRVVDGITVEQLEWQAQPGMNTVGMLLAHIAVAETFWMAVAPLEMPQKPEGDEVILKTIGIRGDDDGLPLPEDGVHPATLASKSLDNYFQMLDSARAATHATLKGWSDEDLDKLYQLEDYQFSHSWTVYHIFEHLVGHLGQVRLLKRLMQEAGVMQKPTTSR
jgi:uncharacterized damage-inducible protein DinB